MYNFNEEDMKNLTLTFKESKFFENLFTGVSLAYIGLYWKKIYNYITNLILYSPGVGVVKIKKNRGYIKTNIGVVSIPLIKMPSFDLDMGFFKNQNMKLKLGIYDLEKFLYKIDHDVIFEKLNTINRFWITDINNPRDFINEDTLYGYIVSHMDNIVYIFKIENNENIDYNKIIKNYEDSLENYESSEESSKSDDDVFRVVKEEYKLVNDVCCVKNENCNSDDVCCIENENCNSDDVCCIETRENIESTKKIN